MGICAPSAAHCAHLWASPLPAGASPASARRSPACGPGPSRGRSAPFAGRSVRARADSRLPPYARAGPTHPPPDACCPATRPTSRWETPHSDSQTERSLCAPLAPLLNNSQFTIHPFDRLRTAHSLFLLLLLLPPSAPPVAPTLSEAAPTATDRPALPTATPAHLPCPGNSVYVG